MRLEERRCSNEIPMRATIVIAGLWAAALCARAQHAADTIAGRAHHLREVEVEGRAAPRSVTSSAPTHTLGREQMQAMGVTDIADAVNRLPGITLRDYGGAGGMKTVAVRGFGAQHTGVSYDGILLSDCQSGEIDVSRYSIDNIDRLSLVIGDNDDIFVPARNASSAALLSIQTIGAPTADSLPHLTAQLKAGSFGYASPFVRYEQNLSPRLALSAAGTYIHADNDYPFTLRNITLATRERRTNSRMNSGHGELNFLWSATPRQRLGGKLYYYDNDRQLPGQVRYYTNISNERLHDQNAFGQLHYAATNGRDLTLKCLAKYNWAASVYRDGPVGGGISKLDYRQREAYASACLLYRPSEAWALDYSADYILNSLRSNVKADTDPTRSTVLQSAAAKFHTPRLTAMGRLLHSLYLNDTRRGDGSRARNDRRLSPSLSLSYKLLAGRELYLRASYKNIFRAPTFNENYYFHYGSTGLKPESTDQLNVGLTALHAYGQGSSVQATLDGYLNHVRDKIIAVPYNMFIWTNINLGTVRAVGIDATLSATHRFSRRHALLVAGSYSYQQAENRTMKSSPYYGNQLPYVPLHSGSLALSYENPWVNVSVHGTGVSSRHCNVEHLAGTDIDGYCEVGATAYRRQHIGRHVAEARLDVKNLLDQQYEIVRLYPMPGRSWQLTLAFIL